MKWNFFVFKTFYFLFLAVSNDDYDNEKYVWLFGVGGHNGQSSLVIFFDEFFNWSGEGERQRDRKKEDRQTESKKR